VNQTKLCLSLLALIILSSGCTNGGEDDEPKGSVEVHSLTVTPQQIYSGSEVRAILEFSNVGSVPAELSIHREGGEDGRRVLTNFCPDLFDRKDFSASPQRLESQGREVLEQGQSAQLSWRLQQQGNVPRYGRRCDMDFQVPFDYSVSAYKQVQIKESEDVEGSELNQETTSGPLSFIIETVGGTGAEGQSTFVRPRDETMTVLIQMRNHGQEGYNKGIVDIDENSFSINSSELGIDAEMNVDDNEDSDGDYDNYICTGPRAKNCAIQIEGTGPSDAENEDELSCNMDKGDDIRMFEGQSRIFKCNVPLSQVDLVGKPSIVAEINTKVNYTYIKDIGSREVEVQYRGG